MFYIMCNFTTDISKTIKLTEKYTHIGANFSLCIDYRKTSLCSGNDPKKTGLD